MQQNSHLTSVFNVPTFSGTFSDGITHNNLSITDHQPVVAHNTPVGTLVSLNIWCPGSPVSPSIKPKPGVLDQPSQTNQMKAMAKYLFQMAKEGQVPVFMLQEVPHPNSPEFAVLNDTLKRLCQEYNKNNPQSPLYLDFQHWQPTSGTRSGTCVLVNTNQAKVKLNNKLLNENGMVGRYGCYNIQSTRNPKNQFTIYNVHGDYEQKDAVAAFVKNKHSQGAMVCGDFNVPINTPAHSILQNVKPSNSNGCNIQQSGNTLDGFYIPDALLYPPQAQQPASFPQGIPPNQQPNLQPIPQQPNYNNLASAIVRAGYQLGIRGVYGNAGYKNASIQFLSSSEAQRFFTDLKLSSHKDHSQPVNSNYVNIPYTHVNDLAEHINNSLNTRPEALTFKATNRSSYLNTSNSMAYNLGDSRVKNSLLTGRKHVFTATVLPRLAKGAFSNTPVFISYDEDKFPKGHEDSKLYESLQIHEEAQEMISPERLLSSQPDLSQAYHLTKSRSVTGEISIFGNGLGQVVVNDPNGPPLKAICTTIVFPDLRYNSKKKQFQNTDGFIYFSKGQIKGLNSQLLTDDLTNILLDAFIQQDNRGVQHLTSPFIGGGFYLQGLPEDTKNEVKKCILTAYKKALLIGQQKSLFSHLTEVTITFPDNYDPTLKPSDRSDDYVMAEKLLFDGSYKGAIGLSISNGDMLNTAIEDCCNGVRAGILNGGDKKCMGGGFYHYMDPNYDPATRHTSVTSEEVLANMTSFLSHSPYFNNINNFSCAAKSPALNLKGVAPQKLPVKDVCEYIYKLTGIYPVVNSCQQNGVMNYFIKFSNQEDKENVEKAFKSLGISKNISSVNNDNTVFLMSHQKMKVNNQELNVKDGFEQLVKDSLKKIDNYWQKRQQDSHEYRHYFFSIGLGISKTDKKQAYDAIKDRLTNGTSSSLWKNNQANCSPALTQGDLGDIVKNNYFFNK